MYVFFQKIATGENTGSIKFVEVLNFLVFYLELSLRSFGTFSLLTLIQSIIKIKTFY